MYFYITDLSRQEIRLFNEAPALCFVRVHRQRRWVRGMKSLGLNVNEETLQIEWIAPWSPIETQHNQCMNEVNRVYPGHFIIEVNGTDDRGRMLELLDNASTLSITVAHVLRDGTSAWHEATMDLTQCTPCAIQTPVGAQFHTDNQFQTTETRFAKWSYPLQSQSGHFSSKPWAHWNTTPRSVRLRTQGYRDELRSIFSIILSSKVNSKSMVNDEFQ